jgi:exodeoxyribonuclease-3
VKIATYNVNSIRQRLPIVLEWLAEYEPDVLAVQETKCEDAKFPVGEFEDLGYHVALHGQKGFNGVATISREPLVNVTTGLGDPLFPEDCRVVIGDYVGVSVINTYVPNGTAVGTDKFEYKLRWLERFGRMVAERYRPTDQVVWLGDINIAPTPNDVYNAASKLGKVGHHPAEFKALEAIGGWGWEDCFRKFTAGPGHYTYWDYVILTSVEKNFGWRIDHIYASPGLYPACIACEIDRAPRSMEKPSDHTVVWAEFDV